MFSLRPATHLAPKLALRIIQALECPVCRILRSEDEIDQDAIEIALMGVVAKAGAQYGVCCGCGRIVGSKISKDKNYRQRWARRWKKLGRELLLAPLDN